MVVICTRPMLALAICATALKAVLIGVVMLSYQDVQAQDDVDMSGFWQKKGEAFVIEFKRNEDSSYTATVVRADWEPGKIDSVCIQGLRPDTQAKRWEAQVFDFDDGSFKEGSVSLRKETQFTLRARGQRRSTWIRIPSEKELL